MQAIINRSDLKEREKVTLYNQILDRYNDIDEKRVQEPTRVTVVIDKNDEARVDKESESTPSGIVEVEIVDSVRKKLKREHRFGGKTQSGLHRRLD